jgi:DNA-binding PadR family transcriptional regulator
LEPTLLLLLHQGPAHGYTLIEQLGEFGLVDLHPSVVYRALRDMDEKGWVTSSWNVDETQGPPRRVYRLTAQGDEVLGAYMQDLRQTHEQIGHLMDVYNRHIKEGKGEHH